MHGESDAGPDDLIGHLVATSGLSPGMARRIVEDVLAYHAEPVEAFVLRRHRELAAAGLKNAHIYRRLADEVAGRVFVGPRCSTRQIRRMIYG